MTEKKSILPPLVPNGETMAREWKTWPVPKYLLIFAVLALVYFVVVGHASVAKGPDHRAIIMLTQLRYQLALRGVEEPEKNVGLDFGLYAGCRKWLLEHVVASGCIGLRIEESVRSKASPEIIHELAQELCRTGICAYDKKFVLSVRYLRIVRTYEMNGGIAVAREQSGHLTRYWLEGRNK